MLDRSSISSFEARRLPWGAIAAVGILGVVHLAAVLVCREPVARPVLRSKFRQLTQADPRVVLIGDSRMKSGVQPALIERSLGLPSSSVVNLAESACDSPAITAAWKEFAPRLGHASLIVLNVSFFAVNDNATDILGDELLWDMSWADRLSTLATTRAVASVFLPEKMLWQRFISLGSWAQSEYRLGGFDSSPATENVQSWSADQRRQRIEALRQWWYTDPKIDGVRWQSLAGTLELLSKSKHELVVLLMPEHPIFVEAIKGTAAGIADQEFRSRVHALCEQRGLRCLDYDAGCLRPGESDLLFSDLVHLNRHGAEAFTPVLAGDLMRLQSTPVLAQR